MKQKDDAWSEYVVTGLRAYESGSYEQAEMALANSLQQLESKVTKQEAIMAEVMHLLANVLRDQDQFSRADELYERAVEMTGLSCGARSAELMRVFRDYTLSLLFQGKFCESCNVEREALKIAEANAGRHRFEVSYSIVRLCAICFIGEHYANAEIFYRRYLRQLEENLFEHHPGLVDVLCDLGVICHRQQKYTEAESTFKRALDLIAENGGSEAMQAQVLNAMGLAICAQGRHSEARPLCNHAARARSLDSESSVSAADAFQALADIYCGRDLFHQARLLCEQASTAREIQFVEEGNELANALNRYVTILERLNSCEKTDRVKDRIARLAASSAIQAA